MPCIAAYFLVWAVSAVLHGAAMLAFGNPIPALVFTLIFIVSGLVGSGVIFFRKGTGCEHVLSRGRPPGAPLASIHFLT